MFKRLAPWQRIKISSKLICTFYCFVFFLLSQTVFATEGTDWSLWDTSLEKVRVQGTLSCMLTQGDLLDRQIQDPDGYDKLHQLAVYAFYGVRLSGPTSFAPVNAAKVRAIAIANANEGTETLNKFITIFENTDNYAAYNQYIVEKVYGDKYQWYLANHPEMVKAVIGITKSAFKLQHFSVKMLQDAKQKEIESSTKISM